MVNIKGSEWSLWNLQVHSPESFGGNDFIRNSSKSEALLSREFKRYSGTTSAALA